MPRSGHAPRRLISIAAQVFVKSRGGVFGVFDIPFERKGPRREGLPRRLRIDRIDELLKGQASSFRSKGAGSRYSRAPAPDR
jgi:hypothetical protein